jgi:hypothetical protein
VEERRSRREGERGGRKRLRRVARMTKEDGMMRG